MSTENYRWYLQATLKRLSDALPHERAQASFNLLIEKDSPTLRLMTLVGAVESLASSILWHQGEDVPSSTNRDGGSERPIFLVERLFRKEAKLPSEVFGEEVWESFKWAVEYAGFIRAECTPLNSDYCLGLIDTCAKIVTAILQRYNIPIPQSPPVPETKNEVDTKPNNSNIERINIERMLTEMFGWSERMTSLLISAGYVGFLAVWAYMHDKMSKPTELFTALMFVISLSLFVFWHAFNVLRMNKAAMRFQAESKIAGQFDQALAKFFDQIGNPHKPFESFWVKRVLPFTIATALLGAVIMCSAFIDGILATLR